MLRRAALVVVALSIPSLAVAQRTRALELRGDAIVARRATAMHGGVGVLQRASRNLEFELVLSAGTTWREDADARASGRADIVARFAPLAADRTRMSAYAGGGLSLLVEQHASPREVLTVVFGIEAGHARRWRPFAEIGLGGGVRAGAGIRF